MKRQILSSLLLVALAACGQNAQPGPTPVGSPTPTESPKPGATSSPTPGTSTGAVSAVDANTPYRFEGRFDLSDPNSGTYGHFAWPGSAVGATFTGTQLSVQLNDSGAPDNGNQVFNWFDVTIDNQAPVVVTTQAGVTSYPVAQGLSSGSHTVWLRKRTEAWIGNVRFLGFDPGTGGKLTGAPGIPNRRVEVVGASTECGYGDTESVGLNGCVFSPATESANLAWPKVMADSLSAEYTNVAYSGKGVYRDIYPQESNVTMPMIYPLIDPSDPSSSWNFASWTPDAVVVDMGGNDFDAYDGTTALSAPDAAGFEGAYAGLLQTIRQHYPKAVILCIIGPTDVGTQRTGMTTDIQAAIAQTGDKNTFFYALPVYTGTTFGCENHPDAALHAVMAQQIGAQLKTHLGW